MTDDYTPPQSIAEMFGEDLGPPLFTDTPPEPGKFSSAARHADRYQRQTREARRERDLTLVAKAAQEQADDEALDLALRRYRRGEPIRTGTLIATRRALARRGYTEGKTSERLAALAGREPGWRPVA
jgi:hypothetical protein